MNTRQLIIWVATACAAMTTSCRSNGTLLPNVSGKAGEIIVAMDKEDWDGNLGNTTREILAADYPFLPQPEPMFSLSNVPVTGFADLFKVHRNLLLINISATDMGGVVYKNDVWAHPQCVIQVSAPSSDSASVLIKENAGRIISTFEQAERDRVIANSKLYEEHSIAPAVKDLTGGGAPHFPTGYKLLKKTSDFLWIADNKQYSTQGVFIYKYPASGQENFTEENIISHRDAFLKDNVPGMFDNTYMITSDALTPEVKFIRYRGRKFAETRGLWEVFNDFMGGPFISHSFYSRDGQYIIVLDGFVYAPKYDKRQYLRQVESILYSFEWDEEETGNADGTENK